MRLLPFSSGNYILYVNNLPVAVAGQLPIDSRQSTSGVVTVNTGTWTIIASISSITVPSGKKVLLIATGDGNPNQSGGWHRIQFFRGSTEIGKMIINENAGGGSKNCPWDLTYVDAPADGTHDYTVKAQQGSGSFTYGEEGSQQAPSLVAIPLF